MSHSPCFLLSCIFNVLILRDPVQVLSALPDSLRHMYLDCTLNMSRIEVSYFMVIDYLLISPPQRICIFMFINQILWHCQTLPRSCFELKVHSSIISRGDINTSESPVHTSAHSREGAAGCPIYVSAALLFVSAVSLCFDNCLPFKGDE